MEPIYHVVEFWKKIILPEGISGTGEVLVAVEQVRACWVCVDPILPVVERMKKLLGVWTRRTTENICYQANKNSSDACFGLLSFCSLLVGLRFFNFINSQPR